MYCDDAEGMVFRPPSEANSFILRVTIGCAHNRCSFCAMYRDVRFRVRSYPEIKRQIDHAAAAAPRLRRVFLADGNALCLKTELLLTIMADLRQAFPKLSRIACYGGPGDILRKSPAELIALKAAGLQIIYLGIESGDDAVLSAVCKGVTAAQMTDAGLRVLNAGIKLSAMIILGLGGRKNSARHAANSAAVVNAVNPTMLSTLSLMLHDGTPLRRAADAGEFQPLSPYELGLELKEFVSRLEVTSPCIFRANHPSNLLPLAATLPVDKDRLLARIDDGLELLKGQIEPTYNNQGPF
ncbi:MAG: radical SAM protein [Sporomusaceae bacterium]|nr:radical SAM protein [Sporomusaceae bacterium]